MANITAAIVKQLREMTGAGMMDCKKALVATDGDMDAAVDFLREKGLAAAQKKASRIAAEGIVRALVQDDEKKAVLVEVNSETDFVAKNAEFQGYVDMVCQQAIDTKAADIDAFLAEPWKFDTTKTVAEELSSRIAIIGEKLSIRRFAQEEGDLVVAYIHGGGRIGVLVNVATSVINDDVKEAFRNLAMQIAAMNPQFISRDDISDEELAKIRHFTVDSALNTPETLPKPILLKLINRALDEKVWSDEDAAIYQEQKNNLNNLFNFLSDAAKAQVAGLAMEEKETISADKIFGGLVEGRVAKQLKDICLLEQVYVKAEDGKQTVKQYLAEVGKKAGAELGIKSFVRFETGEGLEKREDNFAEEVAKQMAGN